jgi:hypothetical protein
MDVYKVLVGKVMPTMMSRNSRFPTLRRAVTRRFRTSTYIMQRCKSSKQFINISAFIDKKRGCREWLISSNSHPHHGTSNSNYSFCNAPLFKSDVMNCTTARTPIVATLSPSSVLGLNEQTVSDFGVVFNGTNSILFMRSSS